MTSSPTSTGPLPFLTVPFGEADLPKTWDCSFTIADNLTFANSIIAMEVRPRVYSICFCTLHIYLSSKAQLNMAKISCRVLSTVCDFVTCGHLCPSLVYIVYG